MFKRFLTIAVSMALAFGAAATIFSASGAGASNPSHVHDHALFDTTSGDTSVQCGSPNKSFEFMLSLRAINADSVARVTFQDGDFVDFPIKQDTSFSLTQAAGDTRNVDRTLVVSNQGPGGLVGWVSASTHGNDGT